MPSMFNTFMADQGSAVRADAQIINGAPLRYNWDNGGSAEGVDARAVLPTGDYGSVIVTEAIPLDAQIQWNDSQGYAARYFDLALSANPNTQFYLYETWHEMGSSTQAWRDQIATDLSKWQGILDHVNATAPGNAPEALMVPAGQAMGNLHDAISAGQVPGLSSIRDLFSDNIHLNDTGAWFVAALQAEVVAGLDASTLPIATTSVWGSAYGGPSAATAQAMAQVIDETLAEFGIGGDGGGSGGQIDPPNSRVDPPEPEEPEEVFGDATDNFLTGGATDNLIFGFAGNDVLIGNAGNDQLDGGNGWDISRYSDAQDNFTLTLSAGGINIQDRNAGGEGTDSLTRIEEVQFMDPAQSGALTRFDLTQVSGTTRLNETQMESVIELYIAFFNRAPDAVGLNFWGTAYANGTSLEEIATLFIDQDEVRQAYPDWMGVEDFATTVYANVLGRKADPEGFAFWTDALSSGAVGRDQFILSVLEGAKSAPAPGVSDSFAAQQLADRQYLSDKTDIGAYFSVHHGMSDIANAQAAMATFDGTSGGFVRTIEQVDGFYGAATSDNGSEFLMPLVGVLETPFW